MARKWQVPDDVVFVEAIPIGATGKMLKTRLREHAQGITRLPGRMITTLTGAQVALSRIATSGLEGTRGNPSPPVGGLPAKIPITLESCHSTRRQSFMTILLSEPR